MKTADELVVDGLRLHQAGYYVAFLYPSQEWMAVKIQAPFIRYEKIPIKAPDEDAA